MLGVRRQHHDPPGNITLLKTTEEAAIYIKCEMARRGAKIVDEESGKWHVIYHGFMGTFYPDRLIDRLLQLSETAQIHAVTIALDQLGGGPSACGK
jgi:hypothetical protein